MPAPVAGLWVWSGVPVRQALPRVARDRSLLRGGPFAKLLGTARGFAPADADLRRWALLVAADSPAHLEAFERSRLVRSWDGAAAERGRLVLRPLTVRGTWCGTVPFAATGDPAVPGPMLALTRARVRARSLRRFRAAVPAVSGCSFAMGIGEWPVGLLGTVSVWESAADLRRFRDSTAHATAVRRAHDERWYAEELYVRFQVVHADGTLA
jgi:hypothetical protein